MEKKYDANTKRSNIKFRTYCTLRKRSSSQFFHIKNWNLTLAHQEGSMQQWWTKNWSNINVFKRECLRICTSETVLCSDRTVPITPIWRLKHNSWWDMMTMRVVWVRYCGKKYTVSPAYCGMIYDLASQDELLGVCCAKHVVISCFSLISTNSKFVWCLLWVRKQNVHTQRNIRIFVKETLYNNVPVYLAIRVRSFIQKDLFNLQIGLGLISYERKM